MVAAIGFFALVERRVEDAIVLAFPSPLGAEAAADSGLGDAGGVFSER
jgi:hypothetical protein